MMNKEFVLVLNDLEIKIEHRSRVLGIRLIRVSCVP